MSLRRILHCASLSCIAAAAWLSGGGAAAGTGAASPPSPAVAPQARPAPCASADHRAFDFWVGDWIVHGKAGKLAGENRIEKRHGGCMLHENYRTPSGYTGESINMYDASRGRWYQTWADNGGLLLRLEGGMQGGSMVMEGESLLPGGRRQAQRITWTPQPDGSVRQHWEARDESGAWSTQFDGSYRRR